MKRPDTFIAVPDVTSADAIRTLSCADALRQREKPVALFTPALLFTHGGFDRDPVMEFDARFPATSADLRPFCVDLRKDTEYFFSGLPVMPPPGMTRPVNWNQRLYAIDNSRAEECFAFLSGIAYSDPAHEFFGSSFAYGLDIADPTSRKNDRLLVTVFGVLTNSFVVFLEPRPTDAPIVSRHLTTDGKLPAVLRGQSIFTNFSGEDPLTMRDD